MPDSTGTTPRPAEARFRTVIEQSPFSTVIFDPRGRPILANEAFARLWKVDAAQTAELVARYNIFEDKALEELGVMPTIRRAFAGEAVVIPAHEYSARGVGPQPAVESRWVKSYLYPIRNEAGAIEEVVLIHDDVTAERSAAEERERLAEELRQTKKMEAVGHLAGGIAHDFNNLLLAIHGHADLALLESGAETETHEHLQEILIAARRAASLTRQLLTFSRRQVSQEMPIDLRVLIDETVGLLDRVIGEQIRLNVEHGGEHLWVDGDPGELQMALLNLCVNARDAMPAGGCITISTRRVPGGDSDVGRIHLSVSDEGAGISEEVREHIFEPFFTTKAPGRGTGIGLSTVYGVATRHGGTVQVTSASGRGSTFTLDLPSGHPGAGADARPQVTARLGHGESVLVVDDEETVRGVLERLLIAAGFRVTTVPDAEEAARVFVDHEAAFDLVVCDVVLPGQRGPNLISALRTFKPSLACVLTSGYAEEAGAQSALGDARTPFLPKPFSRTQLLTAVQAALAARDRPDAVAPLLAPDARRRAGD